MSTLTAELDRAGREVMTARFMKYVEPEPNNGCWLWTGATSAIGYGRFGVRGHNRLAHRVAYELHVGEIPEGLGLDHLCRVRSCVNPAHVEPVTNYVNMMRGDTIPARHAKKSTCPRGHEYDAVWRHRGRLNRACRRCDHIGDRTRTTSGGSH